MILTDLTPLDDATYQFLLDDLCSSEGSQSSWTPPQELSSAAGPVRKTKQRPRTRTIFTEEQLSSMEERFLQSPYIARLERIYLSMRIGVSEEAVKTWFQNRRARRNRQEAKAPNFSVPQQVPPTPTPPTPTPPTPYYVPYNNFSNQNVVPDCVYQQYGAPQPGQVAPQPPNMY